VIIVLWILGAFWVIRSEVRMLMVKARVLFYHNLHKAFCTGRPEVIIPDKLYVNSMGICVYAYLLCEKCGKRFKLAKYRPTVSVTEEI